MPTDYYLARPIRLRLWGAVLAGVGLLVSVAAVLVFALSLPRAVLSVVVAAGTVGVLAAGIVFGRSLVVLRVLETGYQVRFVRGAGVHQARWKDVEDVVTAQVAGEECVVLRLRDGRATTLPLRLLEGASAGFLEELRGHLDRGHGYRRRR